jgi:hypothetical protein
VTRGRIVGSTALALALLCLGACSKSPPPAVPETVIASSTTPSFGNGSISSSTTTAVDSGLAGQPGAASRSSLGLQSGYQETTVEAAAHRLLHANQPTRDTPGTQVHCPGVAVTVGATFVCQVDINANSSIDEPLKVDSSNPLNLEFAVIDPGNFVCSAHAAWVVQAMAKIAVHCTNSPATGQGQGQGGG